MAETKRPTTRTEAINQNYSRPHTQQFQTFPDREGIFRKRIDPFCKIKYVKGQKPYVCAHCKLDIPRRVQHIYVNVKGRSGGRDSIREGRFCGKKCFTMFFAPDAGGQGLIVESFFKDDGKKTGKLRAYGHTREYLMWNGWRVLPKRKKKDTGGRGTNQ